MSYPTTGMWAEQNAAELADYVNPVNAVDYPDRPADVGRIYEHHQVGARTLYVMVLLPESRPMASDPQPQFTVAEYGACVGEREPRWRQGPWRGHTLAEVRTTIRCYVG